MPFITAGYPSLEVTAKALPALERAGAAIVELGFPFSDPIADGPVIASSMHEALKAGVTPRKIFELVKRVRANTRMGLISMVSDSIVTRIGPEHFVTEAAAAGFDGLIVPDIDLEAAKPLAGLARLHGLTFTLLIAPTTATKRVSQIVNLCSGFVYVLARVGVTGESNQLDLAHLSERIAVIRQHSDLPIAVGFGVSTPAQAAAVAAIADAVIVGSALVRRMGQVAPAAAAATAGDFVSELVGALKTPRRG